MAKRRGRDPTCPKMCPNADPRNPQQNQHWGLGREAIRPWSFRSSALRAAGKAMRRLEWVRCTAGLGTYALHTGV